jgi:hypothetical protein
MIDHARLEKEQGRAALRQAVAGRCGGWLHLEGLL